MSEDAPAIGDIVALAIDSAEPQKLARWWAQLLGGTVEDDPDGDATLKTLRTPGGLAIDFLTVPEGKTVKNRLHLDLGSSDFDAAVEQARALGATDADDVYDGTSWKVLRDPEGNEFCILRPPRR
jgi:predicted enzyme related to lactoylglutathione lyase